MREWPLNIVGGGCSGKFGRVNFLPVRGVKYFYTSIANICNKNTVFCGVFFIKQLNLDIYKYFYSQGVRGICHVHKGGLYFSLGH